MIVFASQPLVCVGALRVVCMSRRARREVPPSQSPHQYRRARIGPLHSTSRFSIEMSWNRLSISALVAGPGRRRRRCRAVGYGCRQFHVTLQDREGNRGPRVLVRPRQVASASRAPGLMAWWMRCRQATGLGMNIRPQRMVAASKVAVGSSSCSPSETRNSILLRPAAAAFSRAKSTIATTKSVASTRPVDPTRCAAGIAG